MGQVWLHPKSVHLHLVVASFVASSLPPLCSFAPFLSLPCHHGRSPHASVLGILPIPARSAFRTDNCPAVPSCVFLQPFDLLYRLLIILNFTNLSFPLHLMGITPSTKSLGLAYSIPYLLVSLPSSSYCPTQYKQATVSVRISTATT